MIVGRNFVSSLFAIVTLAASSNAQVATTRYEVVDIGASTAMPYSVGTAVSNAGFVGGIGSNGVDFQQGFNWREDRGIQWLSHPSGMGSSVAFEVNHSGMVVGHSFSPSAGVLWNSDGSVANVFHSAGIDSPRDLNSAGLVTGYRNALGSQSAYVWDGSYADLGFPAPATSSQGYAINDVGEVAGHLNGGQASAAFGSKPAAFLWSPTSGFTTILTSSSFVHIQVEDLSNQGTVVGSGFYVSGDNAGIGWKWTGSTGYSELSTLPGAITTDALAVNESGVIVGQSDGFGTIWDEQGNIHKANDLLARGFTDWSIVALSGINDDGWLTGWATLSHTANSRAVLLRPIPEPGLTGLILLSCASLLVRGRRATAARRTQSLVQFPNVPEPPGLLPGARGAGAVAHRRRARARAHTAVARMALPSSAAARACRGNARPGRGALRPPVRGGTCARREPRRAAARPGD